MTIKHIEEYRNKDISQKIIEKINNTSRRNIRLMEVCGTHTMSIFRSGIRSVLPETISLISGPGCPVCVTAQNEIDAFIELAKNNDVIVTTFGDLIKVPGTGSSLQKERAEGRDIRIVYSTFDALEIAKQHPEKKVVFLGVGFETTAPTIAASIQAAKKIGIGNYSVFSTHKLVPPALEALMSTENINIDGFLLPGHVSVIIGANAYRPFFDTYQTPCVIAGFEPTDILRGIMILTTQIESGTPDMINGYERAVTPIGNQKAQKVLYDVFETSDTAWRGIGIIPESGLKIRKEYAQHDAQKLFGLTLSDAADPKGCVCGSILTGLMTPPECPLFSKMCTPMDPVGPCMVSSEGTCAAFYKYNLN